MIRGIVDELGVPTIELRIAGRSWTAIIDTGFNGDLEVPTELFDVLSPRFLSRIRSNLAGGQTIDEDNYQVAIEFDGQTLAAEATFSPAQELSIGTHLLRRHQLQISFVDKTIAINRAG